ncbi:MAG: TraB/GumN family protein [Spirochaetales bacterium]|nr:TraB/GumN family protein [Spirochaetales bacterium]
MSETITRLNLSGREFILIGTAHVSQESVDEVKQTIIEEKPDRVCIEIDEGRYNNLTQKSGWKDMSIVKVLKEGRGFLMLANLVLSSFQKRLGLDLGVKPGEEMLAALEIAKEQNIPFSFCDREVQITLRRAWSKSGLWGKNKMLAAMLSSIFVKEELSREDIEKLKEKNALQNMMEELAEYMPTVKSVLIDERDQFLATKIYKSEGTKVVAVVGAGHVPGLVDWLEKLDKKECSDSLEEISQVPKKSPVSKIVPFLIPAVYIGLIVFVGLNSNVETTLDMIKTWIILNGSLAAIGALVALAHPLVILLAFIAAPLTSLNPLLAVGVLTGMLQYFLKKPKVDDFERLNDDITTFRGFYKNRFTHILLVFILSNIGSALGTIIAGVPFIATALNIG